MILIESDSGVYKDGERSRCSRDVEPWNKKDGNTDISVDFSISFFSFVLFWKCSLDRIVRPVNDKSRCLSFKRGSNISDLRYTKRLNEISM